MTSPTTDRRLGLAGNTGIKTPVRAASLGNLTLSGLQTVDGVVLASGDRVLVKNQTDTTANGIYDASTAAWTRSIDANGNYDLVKGTCVLVTDGTQANEFWQVNASNPITIGTTSIPWILSLTASVSTLSFLQAGTGAVALSVQTKLRDVVSIDDFGSVGDGVTDNVAAINLATASGAKYILVPEGTYMTSGPILLQSQQTLIGLKRSTSRIKAKAGWAGTAVVNCPSGTYSGITVESLTLDGNSLAGRCFSLVGSAQGAVDQLIMRDVELASAVTEPGYIENVTYYDLDHVLASGGTSAFHLKGCFTGTAKHCVIYNGTTQSLWPEECADISFYRCAFFNNPGINSTNLVKQSGGHSVVYRECTFEAQGVANVSEEFRLDGTGVSACTDNALIDCEFIGLANTKTRCISLGPTIAVFKTHINGCRLLKPAAESVVLNGQSETQINMSCDIVTYFTATFAAVTVLNSSGNPYYVQNLVGQFKDLKVGSQADSLSFTGFLTKEVTVDFASVAANAVSTGTPIAITGVALRDSVKVTRPSTLGSLAMVFDGVVSSSGVLTMYARNLSTSAIDPTSGVYTLEITART